MKKRFLKLHLFIVEENYGTIGEETLIKDKNGESLKIGDLVHMEAHKKEGTQHVIMPVVKNENKTFVMGIADRFKEDGTYENTTITKIKDHSEIATGDYVEVNKTIVEYCEEEVEE